MTLSEDDRERITTSVGIDTWGGGTTQIALSTVREVVAASSDRDGGQGFANGRHRYTTGFSRNRSDAGAGDRP